MPSGYKTFFYQWCYSITDDLSGIYVRGIAEGSAAAIDGRIQLHDQIIAVCHFVFSEMSRS